VLLADEFFFVAIDDRTGKPWLPPKVFGLGLAGALLAELILAERITVDADRVRILSRRSPTDAVAYGTLQYLVKETVDHPVRMWLAFLARDSTEQVAERMRRGGYLRREQSRWWQWWRRASLYSPTDANTAYGPRARLAIRLRQGDPLTWQQSVLCGLVVATGLDRHLLYTGDAAARHFLAHTVSHLTPSLHALVWHLHAAVGDAVLTGRT
jgi:Golgi phosphoprotein 3 GPP34